MRVYNPWVFANYGQPQRQRGYISPTVYQNRYPQPRVRLPRVRRWVGDPLGLTSEEMHNEMKKLAYIGLGLSAIGLFFMIVRKR